MSKIKLTDGVKPIQKRERERLLKTINQIQGKEKVTAINELSSEKLAKLKQDLLDTREHILNNKASYGENYDYALSITDRLLKALD